MKFHSKPRLRSRIIWLICLLSISVLLIELLMDNHVYTDAKTLATASKDFLVQTLSGKTLSDNTINVPPDDGYQTPIFTDVNGHTMTYYLYMPRNYNPKQKYPLVLLLHGGGEYAHPGNTAAQNKALLTNQLYVNVWGPGIGQNPARSIQSRWPSFILVPQTSANPFRWVDTAMSNSSYQLPPQPNEALMLAKEILDHVLCSYTSIDTTRLYITGLSSGGFGTWEAIERWPDLFAAAAPIAGAGDPALASRIVNIPIWDFHGAKDTTVPVEGSRIMFAALNAAGGHSRYTEFPDLGHGIWGTVYAYPPVDAQVAGFYSWLFAQRNPHAPQLSCS